MSSGDGGSNGPDGVQERTHSKIRLSLTLVVLLLVGLGAGFQIANRNLASANGKHDLIDPSSSASETSTPSPTPSASVTPVVENAILQAIHAKQRAAGCGFNATKTAPTVSLGTCKILLIGDSLGNNLGYGMIGQLSYKHTLRYVLRAKASTGLSNSWFYNWPNNLATMLKNDKPNLVVVFLGANDRQNMKVDGKILTFGTASWKRAYSASIVKIATLATKSGAYEMWVGLPIMKPYNYNQGMALITSLYAASAPRVSGATQVALWSFTADRNGNYREYAKVNGVNSKIRGTDGVHFTQVGQNVIATYVINKLAATYHVRLTSSYPRIMSR